MIRSGWLTLGAMTRSCLDDDKRRNASFLKELCRSTGRTVKRGRGYRPRGGQY